MHHRLDSAESVLLYPQRHRCRALRFLHRDMSSGWNMFWLTMPGYIQAERLSGRAAVADEFDFIRPVTKSAPPWTHLQCSIPSRPIGPHRMEVPSLVKPTFICTVYHNLSTLGTSSSNLHTLQGRGYVQQPSLGFNSHG